MQKAVLKYHPNAYLEHKKNVTKGLRARTEILGVIEKLKNEEGGARKDKLTIKAVSSAAAISYASSLHHLRLLEEEKIVKREGKRPYKWKITGEGQKSLADIGIEWELGKKMNEEELLMIPGPVPVLPRIREAMSKPMIFHRGDEFGTMYEEIVGQLRAIFKTRNDPFVLSGSGTCAMEAAIGNLVDEDTRIVCIGNGKFGERFPEIADRYTEHVKALNFDWGTSIDLEAVKEALESKPDVVTMVHNETSTGILNPAREVGKLAREHDAVFVLDCITSIAGDEAPVDDLGADIAIVGSQKCLGAPPGMSAISVSEKAWALIREKQKRRPFYMDLEAYKKSFGKKQTPYTPAVPLFFALRDALEVIKEEGMERRIKRHRKLSKAVRAAVTGLGLSLFPELNEVSNYSNTVTAINIPNELTDETLKGGMRKRGVIVAGGQGKLKGNIFRIATMGNIKDMEVLRTIRALEEVLVENAVIERAGKGLEETKKVLSEMG